MIYGLIVAARGKEITFALIYPITPKLSGLASTAFYIPGFFLLELMNKSQLFTHIGFSTIFLYTLVNLVFLILAIKEEKYSLIVIITSLICFIC